MILKNVKLENFRGYNEEIFELKNMSGIIGKNDVGKSTVLEALDIFFNSENKSGVIQPDLNDLRYNTDGSNDFSITCTFELLDEGDILLDSSYETNLVDEYLLNAAGELEIIKTWNCSGKSLTKNNVSTKVKAYLPYVHEQEFLTMKISDLKKELNNIRERLPNYDAINKSIKAELRRALYTYYSDETQKRERIIEIKNIESDIKDLWHAISKKLPMYFLFQSDRNNSGGDSEVQNPLKIAAKKALADKRKEIEEIEEYIVQEVNKVGHNTIEKLEEFDSTIASELKTTHFTKPWESLFSFDISDEREIPLNKRGSGVRRLILLSYFRAEAEKSIENDQRDNIIYAIEEPETSQHPDYQLMIMNSLHSMSYKNQVIFTTHTPEMAKLLEKESLIYIEKNELGFPKIVKNEEVKLDRIKNTLGILPSVLSQTVICVEGSHDVNFLRNLNNVEELRNIVDLNDISIIPMQGSKLKEWIDKDYFDRSNVKEFHLYDSDVEEYVTKVRELNQINDKRRIGINTKLQEIENYIPKHLIEGYFKETFPYSNEEWKNKDIPKYLYDKVFEFVPEKDRENSIKNALNKTVMGNITKHDLEIHGVYEEVKSWFDKLQTLKSS